ncbi:hypothetical protein DVA86_27290 [Streptomyces armeniacus]|uniref:Uncharacterized protein n=1 Tax=Streptomyces armeniacus TaxID=83291 RepID=A0A345XVW9_9ACTN|nr:hypothetical protein [Streptomyces armeniacus]AXK35785.1 hypothetical protein DVA86_27290 [Streptomyces armeniacus]
MAHTERLNATLQQIRTHPETWDQQVYRDGNAGCFAFHAALLAGAEINAPEDPGDDTLRCNEAARAHGFSNGERITIGDFAQCALELTLDERLELFHPHRTLTDLERIVAEISA